MANGDDNVVNQSTNPISQDDVFVINGKKVAAKDFINEHGKPEDKSSGYTSSMGKSGEALVGTTHAQQSFDNLSYEELTKQLKENAINKEYDTWYEGIMKGTASLFNHTGAAIWDTIGFFDVADWRTGISPIDNVFKAIDNYTWLGDGEEHGNWFTRRAQNVREWDRIYNTANTGTFLDYFWNFVPQIGGSVVGNVIAPGAVLKGGTMLLNAGRHGTNLLRGMTASQSAAAIAMGSQNLSKTSKVLNTLATAYMTTQTTGMSIAQGVYDKVYQDKLFELEPNLKEQYEAVKEKAFQEEMAKGKEYWTIEAEDQAKYISEQAGKKFLEEYGNNNPHYRESAMRSANNGAEATMIAMMPSFFLNLTMGSAYVKTFLGESMRSTRDIIKKSPFNYAAAGMEAVQEGIEEGVIENIAEDYGLAVGYGKDYTISDALNKLNTWETGFSAITGAVVGAGMSLGMDKLRSMKRFDKDKKSHKDKYEAQQLIIKKQNEINSALGLPDVMTQLTSPILNAQRLNAVMTERQKLLEEGKKEEANALNNQILAISAYEAFETGTTENLLQNWEKVANAPHVNDDVKKAALTAIAEIKAMEDIYLETRNYGNANQVFLNRVNEKSLQKSRQELQNQIGLKKAETQQMVAFNKGLGKIDFKYEELVPNQIEVKTSKGGLIEDVDATSMTAVEKEIELELTPKGYVSKTENLDGRKQIEQIKKSVKSYQEYLDLNEQLESVESKIADLHKDYTDMTSKEVQKSIEYQNRFLYEYEKQKLEFEKLKGTDAYMEKVDSLLNYYKGKMPEMIFKKFRRRYEIDNELVRIEKEAQEASSIEQKVKTKKKEQEEKAKAEEESFNKKSDKEKALQIAQKLVAGNQELTKEEKDFYNRKPTYVENTRVKLEKEQQGKEVKPEEIQNEDVNDEEKGLTVTPEKQKLANKIVQTSKTIQSNPTTNSTVVENTVTENSLESVLEKNGVKDITPQMIETVEKLLAKDKPNLNQIKAFLKINQSQAQQLVNDYKANQQQNQLNNSATENNTDAALITFIQEIKSAPTNPAGFNALSFKLWENEYLTQEALNDPDEDWFDDKGNVKKSVLNDKGLKLYEFYQRISSDKNSPVKVSYKQGNLQFTYTGNSMEPNEESDSYDYPIGNEYSYEPKELSDNLSPEQKEMIKEDVGDMIFSLEQELKQPLTFERFLRDFINNTDKKSADEAFNALVLGWKLNSMPDEDFQNVYDKVFKDRKEIAQSFLSKINDNQILQEAEKEIKRTELEENTKKGNPVTTVQDEVIFTPEMFSGMEHTVAYNTTTKVPKFVTIEDDDGNVVNQIAVFEEAGTKDNPDSPIKSSKFLRNDKYLPGEELTVEPLPKADLENQIIKLTDDEGKVVTDDKKNPILITWGEYLKRKVKEKGIAFLDSQEYYDNYPLAIKDDEGDFVGFIHNIYYYNTQKDIALETKKKNIAESRILRKYLIDKLKKGETPRIRVVEKRGGIIDGVKDIDLRDNKKKVKDVNPNIPIVTASMDGSTFRVQTGDNVEYLTLDEIQSKYNVDLTANEQTLNFLKQGISFQLREWDGTHKPYAGIFPTLNEETIDSIVNTIKIKTVGGKEKQSLISNLSQQLNLSTTGHADNIIEDYLNLFLSLPKDIPVKLGIKFFTFQKGRFIFGVGNDPTSYTIIDKGESGPALEEKLNKLKEFLSDVKIKQKNKHVRQDRVQPIGMVDENGNVEVYQRGDYYSYINNQLETTIGAINIGTSENPHYISRIQPNIIFEPVESTSRNNNNASSPKAETKEENKQKVQLVNDTVTDDQLKQEVKKAENNGWSFVGANEDEKTEDARRVLNEGTTESTEFAEQIDNSIKENLQKKPESKSTKSIVEQKAEIEKRWQQELLFVKPYNQGTTAPTIEDINKFTASFKKDGTVIKVYAATNNKEKLLKEGFSGEHTGLGTTKGESKGTIFLTPFLHTALDYANVYALEDGINLDDIDIVEIELKNGEGSVEGDEIRTRKEHIVSVKSLNIKQDSIEKQKQEINARYKDEIAALESQQSTEETGTTLEGVEEFFDIFAESSTVDEIIDKLIEKELIKKDCK